MPHLFKSKSGSKGAKGSNPFELGGPSEQDKFGARGSPMKELRGKPIEEQDAMLKPEEVAGRDLDKKGAKKEQGMLARGLNAIKGAMGGKSSVSPEQAKYLFNAKQASGAVAGQAQHFTTHIPSLIAACQVDDLATTYADGLAKAEHALGLARRVVDADKKLVAAANHALVTGNLVKFEPVFRAYIGLAHELFVALMGHEGPGDHLTEDSFLIDGNQTLIDGRTAGTQELLANKGEDKRTGEKKKVDAYKQAPNLSFMYQNFDTSAMQNYASMYAGFFENMRMVALQFVV